MMKNNLIKLFVVCIFIFNCQNEPYEGDIVIEDNSCLEAIQATTEAAENLSNATEEDYSLLCQIYRDALQDQIEICGDADGSLQATINALGACGSTEEDLCMEAMVATQVAEELYNGATENNLEELCNAYKSALLNQIDICGDEDGVLQAIVDQLGDCLPEDIVPIEGLWTLTFILISSELDIDNDEQGTINIYADMDCHETETVVFNDDGTGEFYQSTIAEYSYSNNSDSFDNVDYIVTCAEVDMTINFDWVRVNNNVYATLTDGRTISFIKGPSVLSLYIEDGFSANNIDNESPNITHNISYVYYKE